MKLQMIFTADRSLLPSSAGSEEEYAKLKTGDEYSVEIKKARNPQHHRKMFSLLNLAFHNQEKYDTFEDFFIEVKLKAGHYQEHVTTKGKIIYVPKSVDFSSMDQTEFDPFYSKVITVVMESFGFDEAIHFA